MGELNLDELERLAAEMSWPSRPIIDDGYGERRLIASRISPEHAAMIAALHPNVVEALVYAARERDELRDSLDAQCQHYQSDVAQAYIKLEAAEKERDGARDALAFAVATGEIAQERLVAAEKERDELQRRYSELLASHNVAAKKEIDK